MSDGYPEWMPKRFVINEPCDMWRGPCACGAWHDGADHIAALREEISKGIFEPTEEVKRLLEVYPWPSVRRQA